MLAGTDRPQAESGKGVSGVFEVGGEEFFFVLEAKSAEKTQRQPYRTS